MSQQRGSEPTAGAQGNFILLLSWGGLLTILLLLPDISPVPRGINYILAVKFLAAGETWGRARSHGIFVSPTSLA